MLSRSSSSAATNCALSTLAPSLPICMKSAAILASMSWRFFVTMATSHAFACCLSVDSSALLLRAAASTQNANSSSNEVLVNLRIVIQPVRKWVDLAFTSTQADGWSAHDPLHFMGAAADVIGLQQQIFGPVAAGFVSSRTDFAAERVRLHPSLRLRFRSAMALSPMSRESTACCNDPSPHRNARRTQRETQ